MAEPTCSATSIDRRRFRLEPGGHPILRGGPGPALAQMVQAQPRGDGGQPRRRVLDVGGLGQPQPGLLHHVLGVGRRTENARGDRGQPRSLSLEVRCVHGGHIPLDGRRTDSVTGTPRWVSSEGRRSQSGAGARQRGMNPPTEGSAMSTRMKNPAVVVPEAMAAIQQLNQAIHQGIVAETTLALVHLRASQINGCSSCVLAGVTQARKAGETDDRLATVAAWRETSHFTQAERAALALTEAVTRLADRPDAVPDDIWKDAADHYDEKAMAVLLLEIGTTKLFNRLNLPTRQLAGAWL
jgi:AhpD family alkylhydroperoxidase